MRKTKRTERETNDHIAMLEYTVEEAERELTAMCEAKVKADIEAQRDADYLAMRAHEHVSESRPRGRSSPSLMTSQTRVSSRSKPGRSLIF